MTPVDSKLVLIRLPREDRELLRLCWVCWVWVTGNLKRVVSVLAFFAAKVSGFSAADAFRLALFIVGWDMIGIQNKYPRSSFDNSHSTN